MQAQVVMSAARRTAETVECYWKRSRRELHSSARTQFPIGMDNLVSSLANCYNSSSAIPMIIACVREIDQNAPVKFVYWSNKHFTSYNSIRNISFIIILVMFNYKEKYIISRGMELHGVQIWNYIFSNIKLPLDDNYY